jgi:hypothetical protein
MKKYADFVNVCAKPLRLMKKYADFGKGVQKKNKKIKNKMKIKVKRKQLNDNRFQRSEKRNRTRIWQT